MNVRTHCKIFVGYYFLILVITEITIVYAYIIGFSDIGGLVVGGLVIFFFIGPLPVSALSAYYGGGVAESVAIGSCVVFISSMDVLLYGLFEVSITGSEVHPLYNIFYVAIVVMGLSIGGFVIGVFVRRVKSLARPSVRA